MSDIRYAKPGDKPIRSASAFNAMLDAARANRRTDNVDPNVVRVIRDPSVLQVVNNGQYAADLPRFAIVGIDDPVFVPIDNIGAEQTLIDQTCMSITWPATDSHRGRFAVLLEPLAIDGVGTARLCDTQIAFVDNTVTIGDAVDVVESTRPDENSLVAVDGGSATVLWTGPARDGDYLFTAVADGGSPTGFSWVLDSTDCYTTPTVAELTADIGEPATINDTHAGTSSVAPVSSQWGLIRFGGGGAGSSSCTRVRFQVIVSDSLTRTALCAIVSRPYGCGINDIPGTVIDGAAVEICDPAGCFFNDPNDLLQGREGWAEYMMPESGTTFCQDGSYYLVPEWQVYSLCCATDTCNL